MVSVLPYLNTLQNDFVAGDYQFIIDNPRLRNINDIFYGFKTSFWSAQDEDPSSYYRPLTIVSNFINFYLYQRKPLGYHLNNILWFAGIVVLLYLITHLMTENKLVSLTTALLFAVHPLHCHTVSYIQGIGDLLSAFFFFLSLWGYIHYRKSRSSGSWLWLAVFSTSFILAIFSKEIAITFPIIVLLYDIFNHDTNGRLFNRKMLMGYASIGVVIFVYFYFRQRAIGTYTSLQWDNISIPFFSHLLTVVGSFGFYVRKFILPVNLSFIVPMFAATTLFDVNVLSGIFYLALGFLFAYLFRTKRISKWFLFAYFFYLITLLPLSNIIPISYYAKEHFAFIPSAGLCLLSGLLFHAFYIRWQKKNVTRSRVAGVIFISIILGFSFLTWKRNRIWASEVDLLEDAVQKMPKITKEHLANPWDYRTMYQYVLAYNSLSVMYMNNGNLNQALECLSKGIFIAPDFLDLRDHLGIVYMKMGKYRDAEEVYRKILTIDPKHYRAWTNLGNFYSQLKKYPEAIESFHKAIEIKPDYFHALNGLGIAYYSLGKYEISANYYEQCTALYPDNPLAWQNLAITYSALGDMTKSQQAIARYKALSPR